MKTIQQIVDRLLDEQAITGDEAFVLMRSDEQEYEIQEYIIDQQEYVTDHTNPPIFDFYKTLIA